jgi:signal transduction histidine kinase
VGGLREAIDKGQESWETEYRLRCRNGAYAIVQDKGFILRDPDGRGQRMVGGIRNVTEQRQMELQSVRTQRMESIGTLASGIAHDLNNVLTPVMMSIELLKFDKTNSPERAAILDTIQVSCRRGADLVRQVLTFARDLDGQRVPVDLRQLIGEFKRMVDESFPRNIRLVTDAPADLWSTTGDPTQFHQVLLNLAVNARDAMPGGGILTLRASNVTLGPHRPGPGREAKAGKFLLLQLSDTGTGISTDNCEHIFEPFFTTKKLGEGTGFGLAIVHTIVKSHGGFLSVDSEIGRGSTFNIYLPADPSLRATVSQPPSEPPMPRGRGELVLVVDDESAIREITRLTLESCGYRVITARNGAEAVEIYGKRWQEISLVLTDMMMPVMDGAAAVRALKLINPAAKIVIVSGLEISRETLAKVNRYLTKPYSAQVLARLVREVLDVQACPL